MGRFEQERGRLKPLLGEASSSFVASKRPQDGIQEHFCAMLKGKIACSARVYWLSAFLDALF